MTHTTARASVIALHSVLLMHPGLQIYLSKNLGDDDWVQGVNGDIYVNAARVTISAVLMDIARYLFDCHERAAAASLLINSL